VAKRKVGKFPFFSFFGFSPWRSNFGDPCNPHLGEFLHDLVQRKLVDELVEWVPKEHPFDAATRAALVSKKAEGLDGPPETIGAQFFHEISKRDVGRRVCLERGASHVLLMDTDEFYLEEELRFGMRMVEEKGYETTACRMRLFLKHPTFEYFPFDNWQAVPFICRADVKLALAAPFAGMMVDPTRRPERLGRFFFFERGAVEMYHFTFVRLDMRKKIGSVSNKSNYAEVEEFLRKFESYDVAKHGPIHPHPLIGQLFSEVRVVPNYFDIHLEALCSGCMFVAEKCVCEKKQIN
jgi:hypothetical protein